MPDFAQLAERVRWQDVVDVGILTLVVFRLYLWSRRTVAMQVLAGLALFVAAALAASWAGLLLTTILFQAVGAASLIVAVVVFREEIRRAMRQSSPIRWWRRRAAEEPAGRYAELAHALRRLAAARIGALVVVPRADDLDEHVTGGCQIDAVLSRELLEAIFHNSSPIHDGAVWLRDGRVVRAGVLLPLSRTQTLPDHLGTRHRAAIGLSEVCDAIVLVVSEERGEISIAHGGRLTEAPATADALEAAIEAALAENTAGTGAPEGARRRRVRASDAVALVVIFAAICATWYGLVGGQSVVIARRQHVEIRAMPEGHTLKLRVPESGEVTVRLRGPRRLVEAVGAETKVWIDLSGLDRRWQWVDIRASAPPGVSVVDIAPAKASIRLERERPERPR